MAQRVTVKISRSELARKIVEVTGQSIDDLIDDGLDCYELCNYTSVSKDLDKVQFDLENFDCQADGIGNINPILGLQRHWNKSWFPITFLGCFAGGDWECPIYFIIYWDGSNLRAYIPTEGNTWSRKTKAAYGNHDNEDADDAPDFDVEKLLKDIKSRFTGKR